MIHDINDIKLGSADLPWEIAKVTLTGDGANPQIASFRPNSNKNEIWLIGHADVYNVDDTNTPNLYGTVYDGTDEAAVYYEFSASADASHWDALRVRASDLLVVSYSCYLRIRVGRSGGIVMANTKVRHAHIHYLRIGVTT